MIRGGVGQGVPGGGRRRCRDGLAACFVLALAGCAPHADAPLSRPVEAMEAPWGPFARQCDSTRVSHTITRWRQKETQVGTTYESCAGFSSVLSGPDAAEITASIGRPDDPASSVVVRLRRSTAGTARPAGPGDGWLLAQGSDAPAEADLLARGLGLTARQMVNPRDNMSLPVRLRLPFPVDASLSCRPDGLHRDRDREMLVMSCTLDEKIRTDHLDAQVQLAGVEVIDVQTGVRLSSALAGQLSGRARLAGNGNWQAADERLLYRRETEFQ